MKEKKNKFIYILIAASVLVWGVIILNVIRYYTSDSDEAEAPEDVSGAATGVSHRLTATYYDNGIQYIELHRDPFLLPKAVKQEEVKPALPAAVPKPPQIRYSIKGVVITNDDKTILFEDITNNKLLHLYEGSSYLSLTIISIDPRKIILEENGIKKEVLIK